MTMGINSKAEVALWSFTAHACRWCGGRMMRCGAMLVCATCEIRCELGSERISGPAEPVRKAQVTEWCSAQIGQLDAALAHLRALAVGLNYGPQCKGAPAAGNTEFHAAMADAQAAVARAGRALVEGR